MSEKSTAAPKINGTKTAPDKRGVSGNGRTHESRQVNPTNPRKPEEQELPIHPWTSILGKYADDPDWDELMAAIHRNREELDAEASKAQ